MLRLLFALRDFQRQRALMIDRGSCVKVCDQQRTQPTHPCEKRSSDQMPRVPLVLFVDLRPMPGALPC
jgi:hypothetical protein